MNRRKFIKLLGSALLIPYVPKVFYSFPAVVEPVIINVPESEIMRLKLVWDGQIQYLTNNPYPVWERLA